MKLIEAKYEIIPQAPGLEGIYKNIEIAARNCYKSESFIKEGSADRIVNDIYSFLDVAVLIKRNFHDGRITRYIDQVCFFSREKGKNVCQLIVDEGKVVSKEIPYEIKRKFEASNVENIFTRSNRVNLF